MASVTVIFAGQEQRVCQLDKPKLVVGREPSCDVPIDNLGISRQHCAFLSKGEAFIVQDLGSSNGTYVNGVKVTERFLNDGDEVIIGKYTLKFKNEQQTAAAPKAAPDAAPDVPETLNTYVMDGQKIQEQLAKMRAAQGAGEGSRPPVAATAKDYAKALDPSQGAGAAAAEIAKLKTFIAALVAVVVVLLIVIILMFAGVIQMAA